jgi:prevent-host-death family protein
MYQLSAGAKQMRKVSLTLARRHLDQLLEAVSMGEPLIITRRGIEVAALVPPEKATELAAMRERQKSPE